MPPFIEAGDEVIVDTRNLEYVKKINENGATIIWVSHALDEIDSLCDRFLVMKEGEIIIEKKVNEIELAPSEYIYKEFS